jgi:ribonuclease-3
MSTANKVSASLTLASDCPQPPSHADFHLSGELFYSSSRLISTLLAHRSSAEESRSRYNTAIMNKRPNQEPQDSAFKRHKESHQTDQHHKQTPPQHTHRPEHSAHQHPRKEVNYDPAINQLPPSDISKADIPVYTPFTVAKNLPPLPEILDPKLAESPFRHKSHGYDRNSTVVDITYERLEFLGDAYLELLASRLIFHHFPALQAGSQSQLRELLVKNETLSEYARLYGFQNRVQVADLETMQLEAKNRGNKGLNKILGDVFEAYIAAIVLSDPEHGFVRAEAWLTALWTPKLLETQELRKYRNPKLVLQQPDDADAKNVYSPTAKADLQRRIQGYDAKLVYGPYKASVELKGDQLGQNRHFISLRLTGYGYEDKLLGQGEGKNKVEAGNWAAIEAMHGENKAIVEDCEQKLAVLKEAKKKEKLDKEAQAGSKK